MAADKNISTLIGGRKKSRQSKKKTQRKPKTKKIRRIGITVGSDNGEKHPYFEKNKEKYSILDDLIDTSNGYPYDYAVYAECKALEKKYNVEVIPLDGFNLDLKLCNTCDCIFCVIEGTYNYMYYGDKEFNHYINTLKKTTANVYPSVKMQEFILYKNRYMKYLNKKSYDIIDTEYISLKSYKDDKTRTLDRIKKFIDKNNYKEIIIKPEIYGSSSGIKIYKNSNINTIKKYLDKVKYDYKNLLLQPLISDFVKNWEIKTYWINGKHIFSYGHKKISDGRYELTRSKSMGGKLDDKLVLKVVKIGKQVIKDLFKDKESLIQCRIDFGCCVEGDKDKYFINEVEVCPALALEDSKTPYYHLLAKEIIKKCCE